jgi:hypothetical protein
MPKKMRHHFGWEDAATTEEILSNGSWRADYNGTQYYLDEEDGHEHFRHWKRNVYKREHDDSQDLTPQDGWNMYDRGWDDCALKEEQLHESWDGIMCQDELAKSRRNSVVPLQKPVQCTHVLAITSKQGKHTKDKSVGEMLHWQKVETEDENITELMEYIREILRENREPTSEQKRYRRPDLALAKRLERLDRYNTGVLERHQFESALTMFGLLDLLSVSEMEDLFDRFATKRYATIKYRAFIRLLNLPDDKKHDKKQRGKTFITGRWRDDSYQARVVISCNKSPRTDEDESTYTHVNFNGKQRRLRNM